MTYYVKPVKIFGDIKEGDEQAKNLGMSFLGYSLSSNKFFILNEQSESGYDSFTVEEIGKKLNVKEERFTEIIENKLEGELELETETKHLVFNLPFKKNKEENQNVVEVANPEESNNEPIVDKVIEVKEAVVENLVDFKQLYMDAMEENKLLSAENEKLFAETVELTQKNTELESELDLLKNDDGKLVELVKSKGYVLIVK